MSAKPAIAKRSIARAGVSGDGREQTYSRERGWTVECTAATDDGLIALGAKGLPRVGDLDGNRICVDIHADRIGTSFLFDVTAEYRSLKVSAASSGSSQGALDAAPRVVWGFAKTVEPIDIDADGLPCVDSAGVPLDPPLEREFSDRTLSVTRREKTFNPLAMDEYADTKNADRFFGYPPGLVRFMGTSDNEIPEGRNTIHEVTYQFVIRYAEYGGVRPGWRSRRWNAGRVHRVQDYTVVDRGTLAEKTVWFWALRPILDNEGNPVSSPVPLDPKTGGVIDPREPLAGGETGTDRYGHVFQTNADGTGAWVFYSRYPSKRYSPLRLP